MGRNALGPRVIQFPQRSPVIGIAGDYCSGKSTLAAILAKRGWVHIEVDALGHEALEQQQEQIIAAFSPDILNPRTGAIDRSRLGKHVFSDPQKLARLEALVHPYMVRRVEGIITAHRTGQQSNPILVNAAILYKMKLDRICDIVLWIQAPLFLRLLRAKQRDSLGWGEIFRRFSAQKISFPQLRHSYTDMYRVDNIVVGSAIRRIDHIVQAGTWNRTKPTS